MAPCSGSCFVANGKSIFSGEKKDALMGASFVVIGVAAFYFRADYFRATLNQTSPNLNQQREPVAGYALPKVGQLAVLWLLIISGLGLILWSQWS